MYQTLGDIIERGDERGPLGPGGVSALCTLPPGLIATDHYLGLLIDDHRDEIASIIDIN